MGMGAHLLAYKSHMEEGDFIVLDATNAGNADIAKYRKLAKTYRYKAICIDFSDISLEIAKERNRKRPGMVCLSCN